MTALLRGSSQTHPGTSMPSGGGHIINAVLTASSVWRTSVNVTGDVAVSLIAAKSEGEFNPDVYYGIRRAEAAPFAAPAE